MSKTLRLLSLAALLTTGIRSRNVCCQQRCDRYPEMTGTKTGSQQVGRPATDDTITTRQGRYSTKPISPTAKRPNPAGILTPASSARPVQLSLMRPIRTALRQGATVALAAVVEAPTPADAAMVLGHVQLPPPHGPASLPPGGSRWRLCKIHPARRDV